MPVGHGQEVVRLLGVSRVRGHRMVSVTWKDRPVVHESWWSTWGKPVAFFLIGIVVVVAAILLALVLAGVLL
jgi:hypothetical protein